MDVEIKRNFQIEIYGLGGMVTGKDYSGTAFKLSGKMWKIIKSHKLNNKGKNIWVYENADQIFTGVELENYTNDWRLERKIISLKHYAYFKHIGSYRLLKQIGQEMSNHLIKQGFEVISPYIETYGHWMDDETKCETELIMCLK